MSSSLLLAFKLLIKFGCNINFKDNLTVYYYNTNLTLRDALGKSASTVEKNFPFMHFDEQEQVISISDYNKVAKLYGNKTYTLKENEYIVIADYDEMINIRNVALKDKESININGINLVPKYTECKYGFVDIGAQHLNTGIIVVPDNVLKENTISIEILLANFNSKNKSSNFELT